MASNKKAGKISKFVEVLFIRTAFAGIAFVSLIILLHIITEPSIILPKYLPFPQLPVALFQT